MIREMPCVRILLSREAQSCFQKQEEAGGEEGVSAWNRAKRQTSLEGTCGGESESDLPQGHWPPPAGPAAQPQDGGHGGGPWTWVGRLRQEVESPQKACHREF